MTKWQYGLAEYRPVKRTAEAYTNMTDMGHRKKAIASFLKTAGEKGWELCTCLPFEERAYGPNEDRPYGLIFKRPRDVEGV